MRKAGLILSASTLVITFAAVSPSAGDHASAAEPTTNVAVTQPNIIFILADDQRIDTFQTMPTVRERIRAKGTEYVGLIPTSICCPSRTSILTGTFSHTTGVYTNSLDYGGWPTFNASGYEDDTIAVALDNAGYRTGFWGKYLNFWNKAPDGYAPPGWDVFNGFWRDRGQGGGIYYNYELRGTNPPLTFGNTPADYSTNVIKRRAVQFIKKAQPDQPYFAFINPTAPHAPYTTLPKDVGTYDPEPYHNPAVNEADMSDKPSFLQDQEVVPRSAIRRDQVGQGEVLRDVDRMVAAVLNAADLSNTLVIYMSDNGLMWGEHRLRYKYRPYKWATEVPLMMRWNGVLPAGEGGMVANIDIAPTLLDAAGVPGALPAAEGQSVLDGTRDSLLIEGVNRGDRPSYCGVRTEQYLFVEYANGEQELYDYTVDPYELRNKADAAEYGAVKDSLRQEAIDLCTPTPPNFTWTP